MDVEKRRRAELIERLGSSFVCLEEVWLSHATFPALKVRADVVAIPLDGSFRNVPLAFEVKEPVAGRQSKEWIAALRQASDYVYARIVKKPNRIPDDIAGRRIAAAFIYPAPHIHDFGLDGGTDPMLGAMTMALHFRVGQARPSRGKPERFALAFANNEIWQYDKGFTIIASQYLDGRRRFGSGSINAFDELSKGSTL